MITQVILLFNELAVPGTPSAGSSGTYSKIIIKTNHNRLYPSFWCKLFPMANSIKIGSAFNDTLRYDILWSKYVIYDFISYFATYSTHNVYKSFQQFERYIGTKSTYIGRRYYLLFLPYLIISHSYPSNRENCNVVSWLWNGECYSNGIKNKLGVMHHIMKIHWRSNRSRSVSSTQYLWYLLLFC